MADDQRHRGRGPVSERARERMASNFDPTGPHEQLSGHGEISQGMAPRHAGGAPGYGAHGMGYGPQGGSGDAWGVYGVPRDVQQDYVERSRAGSPGDFDQPHGRVGYGWGGSFGSEGEFSSATDRIRPAHRAPPGGSGGHSAYGNSGDANTDAQSRPPVRRGPKNYARSDERIEDEICDAVGRDHRIHADDVTIEVKGGKVTLYGSVAHRQMKHWIEDIAADCYGVTEVENKITVALAAASPADRRISPGGVSGKE